MRNIALPFILLAAVGCADQQSSTTATGNPGLGIARFVTEETANQTRVIGLDEAGNEVAHLTVVHGVFTLTGAFTEDYATPQVDGRKVTIDVMDQQMNWETAGYEPVRELPAPPGDSWAIAAFVADPRVSTVLDRWQIGFDSTGSKLVGESGYPLGGTIRGTDKGDSPMTCDNVTTCGSAYYGTVNTCGGGAAAFDANRVTQHNSTNCGLYTASYDQVIVSQCCPSGSGGQSTDWFAQKACPTTASNATSCGTRSSGACKGCPTYPVAAQTSCSVSVGATVGACGSAVYPMTYAYSNQTCKPDGQSCTLPSDCCLGVCSSGTCASCQWINGQYICQ